MRPDIHENTVTHSAKNLFVENAVLIILAVICRHSCESSFLHGFTNRRPLRCSVSNSMSHSSMLPTSSTVTPNIRQQIQLSPGKEGGSRRPLRCSVSNSNSKALRCCGGRRPRRRNQ